MQKLTSIVATIGPATETEEIIKELIEAGMNVARFNTKHGTPEWHQERIARVRKVAREMDVSVGVLLDLQGPEIRINLPGEKGFEMKEGEMAVFSSDENEGSDNLILIPQNVVDTLQEGNFVMLDDGLCEFEIMEKGKDHLVAKALGDFSVNHRKTMNTPGVTIDMPSLIEADFVQLDGMAEKGVDFVGLSFVRDKHDIEILKQELAKRKMSADIVAKIENQAALDNIDEIIENSEVIMVARGDLAVEVPFEQLSFWQKLIITKCRFVGKPVITATQMLKSMVDHPRPTRAEVSDVANAVYDSTSAVMLSEETTIGKFPVKAVATQAKIAAFNEKYVESDIEDWMDESNDASVTHAAVYMLQHREKDIDAVVCFTETGNTAKLLARFRPKVPVLAATSSMETYNKLSVVFGINPHIVNLPAEQLASPQELVKELKDQGILESGKNILLIYGSIWAKPGLTNSLSLVRT